MKLARLLALLMAIALSASAQVRYQIGDDPHWADPGFDDSAWPVAVNSLVPSEVRGYFWERARVTVPAGISGPMGVMVLGCPTSIGRGPFQIFVNGRLVASSGTFPPHPVYSTWPACVLPVSGVNPGTSAIVAIRRWGRYSFPGDLRDGTAVIDRLGLLMLREQVERAKQSLEWSLQLAISIGMALAGLCLTMLWRRTHALPALGWFGASMLAANAAFIFVFAGSFVSHFRIDGFWHVVLAYSAYTVAWVIDLEFMWAVFGLRSQMPLRILQLIYMIEGGLGIIQAVEAERTAVFQLAATGAAVCLFVLLGTQIAIGLHQFGKSTRARWIGLCAAVYSVQVLSFNGLLPPSLTFPLIIRLGPFIVMPSWVGLVAYHTSVLAMLLHRFWVAWREREELDAEFQAAREMQAELVPLTASVPGFRIESAYHPARQVGGDFFRVMQAENGAALVVVGDVSGKGLKAAMTVAAIAGALDNEDSRRPGEVLARLNRALRSRKGEGFVTCCAALVARSGEVVIANAGHLPPYSAGAELPVEAELPLGIVDGVSYAETRLWLKAGETLTFVSDGVVEAANAAGELFGFERTRAISGDGPEAIARAAREFGQDDDITVVSVGLAEAA